MKSYGSLIVSILSIVALASVGCGADESPEPEVTSALCSQLSPTSSSGAPLDRIELDAAPNGPIRDIWVQYEDGGEWFVGYLVWEDATNHLVVPIHSAGIDGGETRVRFVDDFETGTCDGAEPETFELSIDPLPPAPGESERLAEAMIDHLEADAETFGWTLEQLRATPIADIPTPLWSTALALEEVEGRTFENALTALIDGSAPAASDDHAAQMELVDALIAKTGIVAEFEASTAALGQLRPDFEVRFVETTATPSDMPLTGALTAAEVLKVDIATPQELSYFMLVSEQQAAIANSQAMKTLSQIVGLVGVFPPAAMASLVIGTALFAINEYYETKSNLLPSILNDKDFEVDMPSFDEDETQSGNVTTYTVLARSRRWKVSQTAGEAIAEAIFAGKGYKGAKSAVRDYDKAAFNATQALDNTRGVQSDNLLKGELANLFDGVTEVYVGPFHWGPIELVDSGFTWLEPAVEAPNFEALAIPDESGYSYDPNDVGLGAFTMKANAVYFPPYANELRTRAVKYIPVKEIIVSLDPSSRRVRPGEEFTITATVQNAIDDTLEWSATGGELTVGPDGKTAFFKVPERIGEEILSVRAEAITDTGLRAPQRRQGIRDATAFYANRESVTIKPAYVCASPGEEFFFDAEVITEPGREELLRFEAEKGLMAQMGGHRVPQEEGRYSVTAYIEDNQEASDTAIVEVGNCDCSFTVSLDGQDSFGGPWVTLNDEFGSVFLSGEWKNQPDRQESFGVVGADGEWGVSVIDETGRSFIVWEDFAWVDYTYDDDRTFRGTVTAKMWEPAVVPVPTPDDYVPPLYDVTIKFVGERETEADLRDGNDACDGK